MTHSHLAVQHLIKQAESYARRRPLRNIRPDWLTELATELADLFSPLSGVGRVGFETELNDERWELSLFLGRVEQVGGPQDGNVGPTNFEFDVQSFMKFFTRVDRLTWTAIPSIADEGTDSALSFLVMEGMLQDEPVCVRVHSSPPGETGTSLRLHPDGRAEVV